MYKHILLPTDGSELSLRAAKSVIDLAKALNARVTAVHVYPVKFTVYYGELSWVDERLEMTAREATQREGKKFLDQIAAVANSASVPFNGLLLEDENVWKSILETAERKGCDLIAMAAHGRRGLAAVLLGSETNKVLTHSKIPVLVYR